MKTKFRIIGKILLIIAVVLLVATVVFVTRDTTVDFSGIVTQIAKSENGEITYTISAANGELSIVADSKTKYTLYPEQDILADYVSVDDVITGDYRLFNKERAKNICVTPHSGAIQNKQYAYDSVVYSIQPTSFVKKKHIAIEGEDNVLSEYNYTGKYAWEYHREGEELNLKKDVLTKENFDNHLKDEDLANSIRKNNLNTFVASGTYLLEQKNGDVYYFSKPLPDGDINEIYKLKEVGNVISVENATLEKDIESYYSAMLNGDDKMPGFQTKVSDKCRAYLEGKFAYQRDTVKWLEQKIDKLTVKLERAVKNGNVIFYTASANFKYMVHAITEYDINHTDRIYVLVDSEDNRIIDWYVSGNKYEEQIRGSVFEFADTSTWLENRTLNKAKTFTAPVSNDISPKPNNNRTYVSYNKDTIVTEVMGLDFSTVYDPLTDNYIINNGGMGQPKAIDKIEVTNTYIKLWFTKGSTLHAWMTVGEGPGSIDVNRGYYKRIDVIGEAYYQRYNEPTPSTVTFGKENEQVTMMFKFDKPINEPIADFRINSGKVD